MSTALRWGGCQLDLHGTICMLMHMQSENHLGKVSAECCSPGGVCRLLPVKR